ncbi:MAG: alanine--glyoxylate aminotransferase family protein [Candidatus Dadabacteria bacterium]|nr:MAG: alanine--glyoxylate aminotransferase family protein [Candidatus Dadabacteria bacterium]
MRKRYLLAPGPTPVPPEVLLEMAAPIIHHRTPQFSAIFREAAEGSKRLFGTAQPVLMLAATGTGGMEAAVSNTLCRGDRVVVVRGGKFGERWAEIAETMGLEVVPIDVEWGRAVDPDQVASALERFPDTRAVLVQASETSTTVLHPVPELARLTRDRECLLIVDGITSVGVVDMPMDATGIDVLVTGSQKALMLPPGLALVALSEKAWRFNERADLPRYYFDLAKERDNLAKDTSAYTPAVSMIVGLRRVYQLIEEAGGFSEVYRRHDILARATRAGVAALGLRPLAPDSPSPAATGVWLPEGMDGGKFTKYLRDVMGVTVAGGQGKLKGKIVRLAHIGYSDAFDVIVGLTALEMALAHFGHPVERGAASAAAQPILAELYEESSK